MKVDVIVDNISILCSYGCMKLAKYKLTSEKLGIKYCCCENWQSCKKMKDHQSIGNKGKNGWNKGKKGPPCSEERREKCKISSKLSIEKINKKYPTFSKVEELRYDPNTLDKKIIQVHCKNSKCKNSKVNGGWFTPTHAQLQSRIYAIEKPEGNGGRYYYCSDECKIICPLYNLHTNYEVNKNNKLPYTEAEYLTFKKAVFQRQYKELGFNECEKCGIRIDLNVHHVIPVKSNYLFSLDPDNAVILCGRNGNNCHYKHGHSDNECTYGKLSTLICGEENNDK